MKPLLLFSLLLLGFVNTALGQYKATLDTHSSVIFPSKPKEMTQAGQLIQYSTLDKENKVTAMATAVDASQYGIDSSVIASNYNNSLFVDLILQNIVGQFAGGELVSKKKVTIGKLMGYDVTFKNNNPTTEVPYDNIYARVLFQGAHIYALSVMDVAGATALNFTEDFFKSLKVE